MAPPVWRVTEVAHLHGRRDLHVEGELDCATAPKLEVRLRALAGLGHPVALDLADVSFMDSSGLRLLLDAHRAAERDGRAFELRRPSPAVRRVLRLAHAEHLLAEEPVLGEHRA
jgi:anti-sigma B factor antagonist